MIAKGFILLLLASIASSLFASLVYLVKDKGSSDRTVKALTVRVALSIGLFALLMLGTVTGILPPNGAF
jgi:hypothetical protein